MAYFSATLDFDRALGEINSLTTRAAELTEQHSEYATYIKSAVVLLAAKLEAFAEGIVEDYVAKILTCKTKNKHLPKELKVHSTTHLLKICMPGLAFSPKANSIAAIQEAARIWSDEEAVDRLTVNNKFNYGKHGSSELRGLFERAGISKLFEECQLTEFEDSLISSTTRKFSISPDIDSLTNIRNNIIHSDASPSSITHQTVRIFSGRLWEFCYLVDLKLQKSIEALETSVALDP